MISRPNRTEYADFYANYISKVPDGDLLNFMDLQPAEFDGLVNDLTDDQAIAAARARQVERQAGARTPVRYRTRSQLSRATLRPRRQEELQGFEQDDYVAAANSNSRSTSELLAELKSVRRATLSLLESLTTADTERTGVANGKSISVRAMAYVIAGHAQHHLELLRKQFAGKA